MKIYDCFLFHDESMLLDLRFNVLNDYVDKFVITESTYLHNGLPKKLNFNISNFSKFKKKIEYIVVKDLPPNLVSSNKNKISESEEKLINGQLREVYQREKLLEGLKEADKDDLIIISDSDEIPNLKDLREQKIGDEILIFKQKMFYYKFDLYYQNYDWFGSKATKKKNFISPQWIRSIKNKSYPIWRLDILFDRKRYSNIRFINNGGWHFTCIKKPEDVHKKLLAYSHHHDYESAKLSIKDLQDRMKSKKALYDHRQDKTSTSKWISEEELKTIDHKLLPEYLILNKVKYKDWLEN